MSRIEDLTVAGWHREHDGNASRAPLRDRMPELGSRIVGGLGVLLLSPAVLTAASRSRLGANCGPGITSADLDETQNKMHQTSNDGGAPRPGKNTHTGRSTYTGKNIDTGKSTGRDATKRSVTGTDSQTTTGSTSSLPPRPRADVRMRVAVIASGLAAATALVYTAPSTPWARADVLAPPGETDLIRASAADLAVIPNMDMAHEAATNYSGFIRTPGRTVLVDATPARTGINTVAITVLGANGTPEKVEQWSATATLPGTSDVAVPLKSFGEGVAAADAQLPVAGKWTFTITVRVAGSDPTSYTHVVPIAR